MLDRLPVPERQCRSEWLDDPLSISAELPGNLQDIRRLNRWLGETAIVVRYLRRLLPVASATLLDVATGSGDIPLRALAWAAGANRQLAVTGLDTSREVLAEARAHCDGAITLILGDARHLPFESESFDVVTSSLALHHFEPEDAVRALAEMWRVTRGAILVVDLVRSYPAYWGTWLATRLMARSRITRHDGPLSVLRSYTPSESFDLARTAGIPSPCITTHLPFRQALVAVKPPARG